MNIFIVIVGTCTYEKEMNRRKYVWKYCNIFLMKFKRFLQKIWFDYSTCFRVEAAMVQNPLLVKIRVPHNDSINFQKQL
jgi:hypothetical protein